MGNPTPETVQLYNKYYWLFATMVADAGKGNLQLPNTAAIFKFT